MQIFHYFKQLRALLLSESTVAFVGMYGGRDLVEKLISLILYDQY